MPTVDGQKFPYTDEGMADAARARTQGGNPTRRRDLEQTTPRPRPTQLAQAQPGQGQQIDLEQILQVLMAVLGQGQTQRRPMPGMPPQQMQRPQGMPPQQMQRPPGMPQQMQRPGMPPQMPMRPPQRLA